MIELAFYRLLLPSCYSSLFFYHSSIPESQFVILSWQVYLDPNKWGRAWSLEMFTVNNPARTRLLDRHGEAAIGADISLGVRLDVRRYRWVLCSSDN